MNETTTKKRHPLRTLIEVIVMLVLLLGVYLYRDKISTFLLDHFIYPKQIVILDPNSYYRDENFLYVKKTNDFYPKNIDDLKNVFYTILDHGWTEFHFYCGEEYSTCQQDITEMVTNNGTISTINNFVHPFNSYNHLFITTNNYGKITVNVEKLYSSDEIQKVNDKIDKITQEVINDSMTVTEKIRAFHDYVINTTRYDSERAAIIGDVPLDENKKFISHKATGPLLQGLGLCGGYTDTMAIFLDRLGIPNYKISSSNHIWNLVFIDGKWLNLDLTWDDPVTDTHEDMLLDNFFLISTEQLKSLDAEHHEYDKNVYLEAN